MTAVDFLIDLCQKKLFILFIFSIFCGNSNTVKAKRSNEKDIVTRAFTLKLYQIHQILDRSFFF